MNYSFSILSRLFVRSFYKENAGFFLFIFTVMFFIVGSVDGAGLLEYHRTLATGMLENYMFLLFVFAAWFLYAQKCAGFVTRLLKKPEYSFLHIYNCISKAKLARLFFFIEVLLLLPVLLYGLFVIIIGCWQHYYFPAIEVALYLLILCVLLTARHVFFLSGKRFVKPVQNGRRTGGWQRLSSLYPLILFRFISNKHKIIWFGIKTFTCGMLYGVARNNALNGSDLRLLFLFFTTGILVNGILVYRVREFEEMYLHFYRGLPVSLPKRLFQYSLLYFVVLIPEFITAFILSPGHLSWTVALQFSLSAYSLLLLMNTITFLKHFSMKEFLPILLLLFCVQYIFIMTVGLYSLCLLFFVCAILFFLISYYKSEWNPE